MKMKKRFLSILLSLVIVLGLMPGMMSLTAHAEQPEVTYLDANGAEQTCTAYTVLDANTTNWRDSWYVVNSTTEINAGIGFTNDDVHLILCDGASLTSSSYLENENGNLTIYGQSSGSGTLTLQGGSSIYAYDNVTINGGTLNLSGARAGIYGDYDGITINNGTVKAEGGELGGLYVYEGDIIINGGSVEATSAQESGIYTDYGNVIINGGTVKATGVTYGIAARNWTDDGIGKVIINGGAVQAIASGDEGYGVFSEANDVTIGEETTSFIAASKKGAFTEGVNVKNAIPGTGWTNTAGTEGKAEIAISTEGQTLTYKKVRFPAAAAVVTTAPKANTLTYNGSAQELVTAGVASGGEMQYALGADATTAPTEGWGTSIPAKTDAGTYYVWYKVIGDTNHNDLKAVCIEVAINPADYSASVSNKALSFTGQPQPLVNAGTVSGGTMEYALGTDANTAPTDGWSTEIPTATKPGTYYVWYKVLGDENHNSVDPACIVVTIAEPEAVPAEPESLSDYTLLASMKTSGNKAFKLKWTAVSGAEGYDVFFGDCGGGECTLEKTVTGTSCKIGKLKKGNAYKAFVKAWKTENGQKVYIGEASPDVHAVAGGKSNKYTNAKKISVKKKKLTVAVGGSKKIKASLKKFSNSRRYLNHTAKIRYYSSNRAVATVNANGKVTGVAPGTCTVYAVAENGLRKGVKITVK